MVKLKFHNKGFYNLRRDPGVVKDLERRSGAIAEACNRDGKGEYKTSSVQGRKRPFGRWRTTVITSEGQSIRDNARHNRLLRNLNAGK